MRWIKIRIFVLSVWVKVLVLCKSIGNPAKLQLKIMKVQEKIGQLYIKSIVYWE